MSLRPFGREELLGARYPIRLREYRPSEQGHGGTQGERFALRGGSSPLDASEQSVGFTGSLRSPPNAD